MSPSPPSSVVVIYVNPVTFGTHLQGRGVSAFCELPQDCTGRRVSLMCGRVGGWGVCVYMCACVRVYGCVCVCTQWVCGCGCGCTWWVGVSKYLTVFACGYLPNLLWHYIQSQSLDCCADCDYSFTVTGHSTTACVIPHTHPAGTVG